jgi:NAD(P)-dependent dehydrogenase (short-subunit alcohol dehydrogenase family)
MGRLDGKVALVTGGTTGIGEAIVRRFLEAGAQVAFCARTEADGRAHEAELAETTTDATATGDTAPGRPDRVAFWTCDVTDEDDVDRFVQGAVEHFGGLDIVVANAGTGGGHAWPDEPTDEWRRFVALNLDGTMFTCRSAWPHLVARGGGSVIAISSLSAWMAVGRDQLDRMGGMQPAASYQASKAAVDGLVVHLAGRGGEHGIRVNSVRPGRILTPKFEAWLGEAGIFWSHYKDAQLIKRHGRVDDIAWAAVYLGSDESSFLTGQLIDINGGAVVKV